MMSQICRLVCTLAARLSSRATPGWDPGPRCAIYLWQKLQNPVSAEASGRRCLGCQNRHPPPNPSHFSDPFFCLKWVPPWETGVRKRTARQDQRQLKPLPAGPPPPGSSPTSPPYPHPPRAPPPPCPLPPPHSRPLPYPSPPPPLPPHRCFSCEHERITRALSLNLNLKPEPYPCEGPGSTLRSLQAEPSTQKNPKPQSVNLEP